MTVVIIAVIVFAAGADQLTKALLYGEPRQFIPGFIGFTPVRNQGMAWGLMNGVKWFIPVVSVVTLAVIAILVALIVKYRAKTHPVIKICLAMIIGGAIGNLIDRAFLGYVRDFIATEFIEFPVFNVADMFVTVGGLLLAVMLIFTKAGHEFIFAVFPEFERKKNEEAEQ